MLLGRSATTIAFSTHRSPFAATNGQCPATNETKIVTVSGNFRANNSEAVRDAAVRGLGLALLPTFAISPEIESGALARVLPDWTPHGTFGNSLTAYFIADRQLTPKIRTLVDFLAEQFGSSRTRRAGRRDERFGRVVAYPRKDCPRKD